MDQHGLDAVSDLSELQKFLNDSYRVSYLESHVKGGIAYQIQALREKEGVTQANFGRMLGMPQTVISRLENTEYGSVNINTLLKVANALKIGLEVRFCNFEMILAADVSPAAMRVENIQETVRRCVRAAIPSKQSASNVPSSGTVNRPNVEGNRVWRTSPIPNQPQPRLYPGPGTHNFERSIPMPPSPGWDPSMSP
jgi:transcriptional regulator with XRE-family HTH domain